jgi:hypothetical protein
MRFSLSPKFGKSAGNLLVVGLLASAATGCSSDVTRFGGLFSSSGQDQITTSSIPRRNINGSQGDPVPRADLGGSAVASQSGYGGGNDALNQPYPARQGYDPQFGARPLKRAIQEHLQDPLTMKLLAGEYKPGDKIKVTADGEVLVFEGK